MASASHLVLQSATAQTASGSTSAVEVGEYREALVSLNVSAASGTSPTLAIKLQTSDDGGTTWYDLPNATFTQATAVTTQVLPITNFGEYIRAAYTIGGTTPSLTFALKVVAK